ncbi:hypothetical protein JCM10450v2_002773 [Rhodotorula kratochvilovae]
MAPTSLLLSKVVLVGNSFLLGAFFVHWLADHPLIWQGPQVADQAVQTALRYYSSFYHAPPFYAGTLTAVAGATILATVFKLILSPVEGLLFDGATLMLLLSALTVYTSNVLAALRYLPLDVLPPSSFFPAPPALARAAGDIGEVRLVEALQSVAASHLIIAVSLTGVLALQGAQGWAERPSSAGEPVAATPSAPASAKREDGETALPEP